MGIPCTEAIFRKVIRKLSEGKSLSEICRKTNMPSRPTVLKYKNAEPDRVDRYAHARIDGVEAKVDLLHSIPDDEENPHKARLKCDNIKWEASKLAPKIYGDKIENTGTTTIRVKYVKRDG